MDWASNRNLLLKLQSSNQTGAVVVSCCCFLVSASLMKNSGVIVANDASKERLKAVIGNIHRLGMKFHSVIFACFEC